MKLAKEYLQIGDYFHNGEAYTREELLNNLEALGINRNQGVSLIADCIKRGFLIEFSGIYTR